MAECKFQLSLMNVGLILVALGTLEYTMAATASNVALHKPANLTDETGGAGASLAVDGDPSTCAETASAEAAWTLDLTAYYVIDEVSIHSVSETVSHWATSVGQHSSYNPTGNPPENILGDNDSNYWYGTWIEVAFAKKVRLSRVDIYEYIDSYAVGVGEIACYVDAGWVTIWSTTSIHIWSGRRTFSPNLTQSWFSDRIKLTKATGGLYMAIDAVRVHEIKSYKIGMGLTHLRNETENTMNLSTTSTATWSPGKGPYRYVKIQANPKTETLTLCEVQIKGYPQPRTPHFRAITGVTMSNPPVSTVFRVFSNSECSTFCLSETEPACVTAQFDKAKQSCALFDGLNHTHDHRNSNVTLVFQFAAHFFEN